MLFVCTKQDAERPIPAAKFAIPIVWEAAAEQDRLEVGDLRHPTSAKITNGVVSSAQGPIFISLMPQMAGCI